VVRPDDQRGTRRAFLISLSHKQAAQRHVGRLARRLVGWVQGARYTVAAVLLFACGSIGCGSSPSPTSATSAILGPSPTPESAAPRIIVLARNLHAPDDLALASDGSIYFSDVADGTLSRLDADGTVTVVLSGLAKPEGIALLPDGSIVVAEQTPNLLSKFNLTTRELLWSVALPVRPAHSGVDNILFDANSQTLIVPDSSNGSILYVALDGTILRTVEPSLARPVSADLEADGSLLVADENANAILRIPAQGGAASVLAQLPAPDDVVTDAQGNIYAIAIGNNALYHIDAHTGAARVLLHGLAEPQGISFDIDHNLVVTEPTKHRIIKIVLLL